MLTPSPASPQFFNCLISTYSSSHFLRQAFQTSQTILYLPGKCWYNHSLSQFMILSLVVQMGVCHPYKTIKSIHENKSCVSLVPCYIPVRRVWRKESEPGRQRKGKFIKGKWEDDWTLRSTDVLPFWWGLSYTLPANEKFSERMMVDF